MVAGCQSVLESGPEPTVENTEVDRSIVELVGGEAEFHAEIVNEGGEGEVRVTLTLTDGSGQTVGREREEFYFREGERRRVTIPTEVPESAESFEITAEAA